MLKIIAFPFAGGNKFSYQRIFHDFNSVHVIDYPRSEISDIVSKDLSIHSLVKLIIPKVLKEINSSDKYIVYGHSMGGVVAYLVTHFLRDLNVIMPEKLIVSGCTPPSSINNKYISRLPDDDFWNEILLLGGIPEEIGLYPDLVSFYLPILRHDFMLIESYKYKCPERLNIPIDVFFGSEELDCNSMVNWENESIGLVQLTKLNGNHFFIFNHLDFFKSYFNNLKTFYDAEIKY